MNRERISYCLILHSRNHKLLIFESAAGWCLPTVAFLKNARWWEVAALNKELFFTFGISTRVLRCIPGKAKIESSNERFYVLECVGDLEISQHPASRWVDPCSIQSPLLFSPAHRKSVAIFLEEESKPVPLSREPWVCLGWLAGVSAFLDTLKPLAPVAPPAEWIQLRAWSRSCIYEVPTGCGTIFFKALPIMSHYEASLTEIMSKFHPDLLPEVLGVEKNKGWLVLGRIDGAAPGGGRPGITQRESLEKALKAWGSAQRSLTEKSELLVKAGCPVLLVEEIPIAIEKILNDSPALLLEQDLGLSETDRRELIAALPKLRMWCRELSNGLIRPSLEHGDFRAENILIEFATGLPKIIDFGAATISHPFFSAVTLVEHDEFVGSDAEITELKCLLKSAYLSVWQDLAPRHQLERTYELACWVGPCAAAVQRYNILLPGVEDKGQWASSVPYWLKLLLEKLKN